MEFDEFNESPDQNPDEGVYAQEPNAFRPPEEMESSGFMPYTQSQERLYRGDGVGRKESPFADASCSSAMPSEEAPVVEEPAAEPGPAAHAGPWNYPEAEVVSDGEVVFTPEPPKASGGKKNWLSMLLSAGISVAVAAIICVVMVSSLNTYWKEQNALLSESFDEKLTRAKEELRSEIEKSREDVPVQSTPDLEVPDNQMPTETTPTLQDPVVVVPDNQTPAETTPGTQPPVQSEPGTYMTPAQVYAQCVNSVVAINCTGTVNSYGQAMQTSSSGSGFILSEDGYVVTNFHVVEGQSKLQVVTYDGTTYDATYIGGNEANDIALIKVDAQGLIPVTVGVSSNLVVGEQVAAIGNPLGELASTLTVGYISAKDRIVATDGTQINMLQTDAAINSGNSGGPLFNMKGEVIGITSAKYSGTTTSGATIEGIGFAIPMDDVLGMLNDLRDYGYITGGYLGISVSDVDQEAANLYGLPSGVLVREVTEGSCAEKAGLKVQDIIVNLGGHDVTNMNDLSRALNKFKAGETVTVTVYRSGSQEILSVTLDERPKDLSDASTNNQPTMPSQPSADDSIDDWFDYFLP